MDFSEKLIFLIFSQILLNFYLSLKLKQLSRIVNIYDIPDKKLKLHQKPIPLIGGVFIILNLIFSYLLINILDKEFIPKKLDLIEEFSLYFSTILLFLVGIYDDKKNLNPIIKLFFSSIVIYFAVLLNDILLIDSISISFLEKRIFLGKFSLAFTILCILLFIHAANLFDGIDLQSISYFIIIFIYLLIYSNFKIICFVLIISLIFLLFMNFKNYLFLGDSGIYLLSFIASFIFIYEHNIFKTILFADEIFILMMMPGIDMIRLVVLRIINRKNVFKGDREHIHHLLVKRFSLINSNLVVITMTIFPIFLFKVFNLSILSIIIFFLISYIVVISFILKTRNKRI